MPAGRSARGCQRGRLAQSLTEFALLAPVLFISLFLLIDFARLVYTYAAVSWAAREAARVVSLQPQAASDCAALQIAESAAQGIVLAADPNSVVNNTDPNNPGTLGPTAPPAGTGYIYIWPAVATSNPPEQHCSGSNRAVSPTVQDVAVQVKYTYQPLLPLIASFVPQITVTTISVVHTEY